jgi:tellurite resistance protein TehA-like permease
MLDQTKSSVRSNSTILYCFLKKELIDDFHPVYFVAGLGTGITGNIFYGFPYPARWLEVIGIIFFCLTVTLFILTNIMLFVSCYYHPQRIYQYHIDPTFSVFFAVHSMTFSTIINGIHLITWNRYPIFLWTLWWIGVAIALYNTFVLFFLSFLSKLNKHTLDGITAVAIMPVVTPVVVSSSGHLIAPNLPNSNIKTVTEITCLMLLFVSLAFFHGLDAIYLMRLFLHKIPSTEAVFSQFLPVGFTGQSSYNVMLFGANMWEFIPDKMLAQAFLVPSALCSAFLLAGGYVYLIIAVASVLSKMKPFAKKPRPGLTTKHLGLIKWNKGFWVMTFPIGTMSLANFEISKGTVGGYELEFFKVMSAIFAVTLFLICIANLIGLSWCITEKLNAAFRSKNKDLNTCNRV